ncbi:MAG: virulence protein RhuM/Fic/DOC family protein [bacterium]
MKKENVNSGELIIYGGQRGRVELKADISKETIWANLDQIAMLFGRDKSVISKHLKNIFNEAELDRNSVVAKNATTAIDGKRYLVEYYNLDAIIFVGYRVNSKQATIFRQWATKTLKEYLIKGIVINSERIKRLPDKILSDLNSKIEFIQRTVKNRELNKSEADSLLSVIHDYAHSWTYLKEYDEGELALKKGKGKEKKRFDYEFLLPAILELKNNLFSKKEASDLFGSERDQSFKGILRTIYQTFDSKELYSSLEEKAAHLLYFIIKDHPFSDGNKRIGSFAFILFLHHNLILMRANGERKINDNTLVALALLIAESDPKEKEMMVALVTNLLI